MKKILLILIALMLWSCQPIKKAIQKEKEKIENQTIQNENREVSADYKSQQKLDFFNLLQEKGFKITSSGNDYEFQYGDFKFKGNANVEFSDKKSKTEIHHLYKIHNKYRLHETYRIKEIFRFKYLYKTVYKEKKGIPYYVFIAIGFFLKIILQLIYQFIKKTYFNGIKI